ncbi:MAG: TonB-dependent receptor, partial [Usitatibacteraceae bacterium]
MRPIAAAVSALLFATGAAYAQQSTTADDAKKKADEAEAAAKKSAVQVVETIVVPGIRRGIESSIAVKRDSTSIVEVVSSEDIGKLPDVSIAESLARLPGLTGQRVDGRVQAISIRGLSGDFAGTLLNGREQVSTGDNRGVEFDQYPSELITRATVYKTPDAGLVGQGISGTVNMESIRPLDFKERQISINLRGEKNSNGVQMAGIKDTGNRVSLSYINQFNNNTVGLALGYAHLDSPLQARNYKAFGWSVSAGNQQFIAASGLPVDPANPTAINTGFEVGPQSSSQKRDGLMAVLEFKPNRDFHSTVDMYHSKFNTREKNNLFQSFNFGRFGGTMTNLTRSGGLVNSGIFSTFSRLGIFNGGNTVGDVNSSVLRSQVNTRDDKLSAFGWNNELKMGAWTGIGDVSYSKATRTDVRYEAYSRIGVADTIGFNMPPDGGAFPTFTLSQSYTNAATLKLAEQFGRLGYIEKPEVRDELKSLRLEGKRGLDWSIFNKIDVGVNYSKRDKSRDLHEDYYRAATPSTLITLAPDLLAPNAPAGFAGIPGFLGFDLAGALNRYGTVVPNIDGTTFGRRWAVHEKVSTAFAKLSFESSIATAPVRGNIGLQVVGAKQNSNGFDQSTSSTGAIIAVPVNKGISYTDVLPSLNVVAELSGDTYIRFGAARTVARPRMDEMRAYNSAGLNQGTNPATGEKTFSWSGNGGNAALKPWVADGLDLSIEKYFAKGSYVA